MVPTPFAIPSPHGSRTGVARTVPCSGIVRGCPAGGVCVLGSMPTGAAFCAAACAGSAGGAACRTAEAYDCIRPHSSITTERACLPAGF